MSRHRLHGETQKRRRKTRTAQLKRSGSAHRVETTQQPAPFERAQEVSGQDMEFLEAMHDLHVAPNPRRPAAPERLKRAEPVRFAAEAEAGSDFLQAMNHLGVRPLRQGADFAPVHPGDDPRPDLALSADPGDDPRPDPAPSADPGDDPRPDPAPSADPGEDAQAESIAGCEGGDAPRDRPGPRFPVAEAVGAQDRASARPAGKAGSGTEFVEDAPDMATLIAETLRDSPFDPERKFEGAPVHRPRPSVRSRPRRQRPDHPDDTLDLHGKTLDEAIRMVQGFMLVSHRKKLRDVLIVTGKGINSGDQGPVLRQAVLRWLERNGERFAREFDWAPPRHGGSGAIWVRMR